MAVKGLTGPTILVCMCVGRYRVVTSVFSMCMLQEWCVCVCVYVSWWCVKIYIHY